MKEELWAYQKELDRVTTANGDLDLLSSELADKEHIYKWMLERKKPYLAKNIENLMNETKMTFARGENRALACDDYKEFTNALKAASEEYFKLKYKYDTLKERINALRTFISLEKEKMSLR